MANPSTSTNGIPKIALVAGGVAAAATVGIAAYYAYNSVSPRHRGVDFYVRLAEQKKMEGVELFRKKDYTGAIKLFKESISALKNVSADGDVGERKEAKNLIANCYNNLSACCESLDHVDESLQFCNEAISIDPKYVKALRRRARIFEKRGKFEESLDDYLTLTPLCTTEAEMLSLNTEIERVIESAVTPELEQLLKDSEGTFKKIPQYAIAHWMWNTVTRDPILKRCEQLESKKVDMSDPDVSNLDKALVLLNVGKYDYLLQVVLKAAEEIDESLAANSVASTKSIEEKAESGSKGDGAEDEDMGELVELEDGRREKLMEKAMTILLAARLYHLHNQTSQARAYIKKFDTLWDELDVSTQCSPEWVDLRVAQLTFLVTVASTDAEAAEYAEAALVLAPDNADALLAQGTRLFETNNHEAATAIFKRAIQVDPNQPNAIFYIHYLNYVNALKAQAVDQVRQQIYNFDVELQKRENPPPFALLLFAKVCMNSENGDLALASVRKVLKSMPNNAYALFLFGILDCDPSQVMMDLEKIRAYVQKTEKVMFKVLEVDPNYWEPYRTLAKISLDRLKFDEALDFYEKAIALARSREDLELVLKDRMMTNLTAKRMREGRSVPFLAPDAQIAAETGTAS